MPAKSIKYYVVSIKYLIIFGLAFYLLFTIFHLPIFAATPLETAQTDYNFQYTKFRDSQEKFISAKAAFISFKTSAAKNDAYLKTQDYLTQATNLYLSYVALVKEYGNSVNWQNQTVSKDSVSKIADDETDYLKQNQIAAKNAQTLEDLTAIAKTLKSHIESVTRPKISFIIANYEFVNGQSLYQDFNDLSTELTATPSASESSTSSLFVNRKTEIENIKQQAKAYLDKGQEILTQLTIKNSSSDNVRNLNNQMEPLKQTLKRSITLFTETLKNR